jgi:hypothetical protein
MTIMLGRGDNEAGGWVELVLLLFPPVRRKQGEVPRARAARKSDFTCVSEVKHPSSSSRPTIQVSVPPRAYLAPFQSSRSSYPMSQRLR